jgi:hypothetical protein
MNEDEKSILETYGDIVEGSDGWYLSNDYGGAVNSAYWSKILSDDDPPVYSMITNVNIVMWNEVRRIHVNR